MVIEQLIDNNWDLWMVWSLHGRNIVTNYEYSFAHGCMIGYVAWTIQLWTMERRFESQQHENKEQEGVTYVRLCPIDQLIN